MFATSRVSVAPLRYGSGVKGKVNQSMAHGVPCVATTIAAEGMETEPGVDILIADTPEAFATAVIDLYRTDTLWQEIAENGVHSLQRTFGMDVAEANLRAILER